MASEHESHSVMFNSLWPSPWNSPGQNTGVGSLSLFQGILPTQGSNPGLPHCRRVLYQLSHQGSPLIGKCSLNVRCISLSFFLSLKEIVINLNIKLVNSVFTFDILGGDCMANFIFCTLDLLFYFLELSKGKKSLSYLKIRNKKEFPNWKHKYVGVIAVREIIELSDESIWNQS